MIASVVPAIRAPRHIDAFDYSLPQDGTEIAEGDLVQIPFRRSSAIGLVRGIHERPSAEIRLKTVIGRYADIRFTHDTLAILEALALRSFSSPSNVLHAWVGTLPKKPADPAPVQGRMRNERFRSSRLMPDHVQGKGGVIETAKELASKGFRTLIVSPWATRADLIASHLGTEALTSDRAMGKRFGLWSRFVRNETNVLVTTRLGAWLAPEADAIILDEPENDDHRQDELSPRYDARWIAEAAHYAGRSLFTIGLTPTLRSVLRADVSPVYIPLLEGDVRTVDVHRSDWSELPAIQNRTLSIMEEAYADHRPVFVIHPIHGDRARLRCADCSCCLLYTSPSPRD